jgi:F-type H+-transporting ATPase subunit gamma
MPTLKEIKGRIGSVKSTLKITSAMKLVSSAKLRKAQNAIAAMRPYEEALQEMLAMTGIGMQGPEVSVMPGADRASHEIPDQVGDDGRGKVGDGVRVIIAIASNSSLCGGFNANAIAKVRSVRKRGDIVYSIGRKMADAMARDGFPSPADYSSLAEHPAYGPAAELVEKLAEDFNEGRIGSVTLVYNHFVSTAKQVPVAEELISEIPDQVGDDAHGSVMPGPDRASQTNPDVIIEPSARELREKLFPKTLKLKLYAAILDSAAAEHAARTIAMQTATDNAEDLLAELTLQYNKGRQQKITSEILDLAGGQITD